MALVPVMPIQVHPGPRHYRINVISSIPVPAPPHPGACDTMRSGIFVEPLTPATWIFVLQNFSLLLQGNLGKSLLAGCLAEYRGRE